MDYYLVNNVFKKLVENWMAKLPNYEFTSKILFQELLFEIYQNIKNNNNNYSAKGQDITLDIIMKIQKVVRII